jgi:hypothetical protein
VPEDFGEIAATSAEDVKIARVRIALQLLLHLKRQALHSATHVRVARRDPDPTSRRHRDHDRNAFKVAAITAEGASAPIRTRTPFNSTSITPRSEPFDGGNVADGRGGVSMITGENPLAPALGVRRVSRRHL